jgi:hypothetical protein
MTELFLAQSRPVVFQHVGLVYPVEGAWLTLVCSKPQMSPSPLSSGTEPYWFAVGEARTSGTLCGGEEASGTAESASPG